jgi:predicted Holliday junction resolvase-like endonuclease
MSSVLLAFHKLQRNIFGICPNPDCGEFFRLSEANIQLKKKPTLDWLDKLEHHAKSLGEKEEKLEEMLEELREVGREKGRKLADAQLRKVDQIFTPRNLNPSDVKILSHPIDYIIFNGMKKGILESIILIDRKARPHEFRKIQASIQKAVEDCRYEWQTLRIREDGSIDSE